jgi:hypothetical protein
MPLHVDYAREPRQSGRYRSGTWFILGLNATLLPVILVYFTIWCVIYPWFPGVIALLPKRGGTVESAMIAAWRPCVGFTLILVPFAIMTRSRAAVLLATLNAVMCGCALYRYFEAIIPP